MLRAILLVLVVGLGVVTVFRFSSAARDNNGPNQQDVIRVEQRMNQLEQRVFSMETTLRNIEQQSRLAGVSRRGVSEEELVQLRSELQGLRQRVADHECALAKLDERTLAPAMRTRRKSGNDPCRQNSEIPIQLSSR